MRPLRILRPLVTLPGLFLLPGCLIAVHGPPPAGASPAAPSATATPAPRAASTAAEACAVWNREVDFAHTVATHDTVAFSEHVHPGAIFLDGDGTASQGRDAVTAGWASILRGDTVHLGWGPTSVLLTGDPHVALSRGPYWLEIAKPGASPKYLTGTYQSVWVKDTDGVWRVLLDGGTPPPKETTPEELERLKASVPPRCPPG